MRIREENKLSSYLSTEKHLIDTNGIWSANPVFVKYEDLFRSHLSELVKLAVVQRTDITGAAEDKERIENELIIIISQIGSALSVLSYDKNDMTLKNAVNVSPSVLKGLRDTDLYEAGKVIEIKASEYAVKLADFGVTQEMISNLDKNLKLYYSFIAAPRDLIGTRKDATERIYELFTIIDDILKGTLDKLINLYEFSEPQFYNKYKTSRMIIDLGVRHESQVEEN